MDLDARLTASEAALYFRCSAQRINRWRSLGNLHAAGRNRSGVTVYRLRDLLEAERKTRRSPNSRRPQAA
jgi:hypothetical protein